MLATLKCTWQFRVVEMGFNFRIRAFLQGTKDVRTGPVKDRLQLLLLSGAHILLWAVFNPSVVAFALFVTFFYLLQLVLQGGAFCWGHFQEQ